MKLGSSGWGEGITRDENRGGSNNRGHSWQVQVSCRGYRVRKHFADSTHGGFDAALREARAWYHAQKAEMEKLPRFPRCKRYVRDEVMAARKRRAKAMGDR